MIINFNIQLHQISRNIVVIFLILCFSLMLMSQTSSELGITNLRTEYKVNPIAMLLSVKLMFDWLGETESAARLENAIAKVIKEGKARTYDMGGRSTSLEVAKEVVRKL